MIGTIVVRDIQLECIIGIHDRERRVPQPLLLALEMDYDIGAAARSGQVSDAIDYSLATGLLIEFVRDAAFYLLETLVYQSVFFLHDRFPAATRIRVGVSKPEALGGNGMPSVVAEERFTQI
jgi:dihydroneopterin aldolase